MKEVRNWIHSNKQTKTERSERLKNNQKKKPSKITVSDVGLIVSIITLLFVISGIFLK